MSRFRVIFVLLALSVAGCVHTMEPVSEGTQIRVQLSIGDTVRVLTKDSERLTFRVAALEPDVLVGEDAGDSIRVPYEDIVFLERREFNRDATAMFVAGGVIIAVLVFGFDGPLIVTPVP